MIKNVFEQVEFGTIRVGDVVHVLWENDGPGELYLNQEITKVSAEEVKAGVYTFRDNLCKFYLVSKAKNPLRTELGAVVEHNDGWKFVRLGKDDWIGITPSGNRTDVSWRDDEVNNSARKVAA